MRASVVPDSVGALGITVNLFTRLARRPGRRRPPGRGGQNANCDAGGGLQERVRRTGAGGIAYVRGLTHRTSP